MNKMKEIWSKFNNNSIIKNILGLGIFRGGYIVGNVILTGLIYRNVGDDSIAGVWFTILSILTWINMLDMGLANGLRNKLTDALNEKNHVLAKKYISTTYYIMGILTVIFLVIFTVSSFIIDWNGVFNVNPEVLPRNTLTLMMNLMINLYLVYFYLGLIFPIYHAIMKSYLVNYISFLSTAVNCGIIFLFNIFNINNVILMSFIYNFSAIVIILWLSFRDFSGELKEVRPSFKFVDRTLTKDILGTSTKFLIIQIATVVLFSTDSFLITKLLGPEEVSPYYFVSKLFRNFITVFIVIMTPFWSAFAKAYYEKDVKWIKSTFKKIYMVTALIGVGIIITIFITNPVINVWAGKAQKTSIGLIIACAAYTMIHIWCTIFQYFLNAIGELNVQMVAYLFAGAINIPLCILLVNKFNLGSTGIAMSTGISLLLFAVLGPITTYKSIKKIEQ